MIRNILVFLVVVFNLLFAQNNIDFDKLDQYIQKTVREFKSPGFAIGIIKDGEVVFKKGYGVRNVETNEPVTTETIFAIASCTKAFTSAAIGICVDIGLLDWDGRVIEYLPWFKLHDPYVTKEATIRDLVTHRMGFNTFDGDLLWYGTDYSRETVVKRISKLPLKNGFRSKYGYSNVMFIAVGLVIERVTGKSWDEFLYDEIFQPLNMLSTTTSVTNLKQNENKATPHVKGNPIEWMNYDNSGPAASLNSNVDDLLKWTQLWLNGGLFLDDEIFSHNTFKETTSSQTVMNGGLGMEVGGMHFKNYGLGWHLRDYSGRKIIWHNGGLPGFISKVLFVPEENLGIVMMANDLVFLVDPLAKRILDLYMNDRDIDYSSETLKRVNAYYSRLEEERKNKERSKIPGTKLSKDVTDYSGVYTDVMYGDAEITLSDAKLTVTLLPTSGIFTSDMEHWQYDTFKIKFNDKYLPEGYVNFEFNGTGDVDGFTIDLPNPDFHFYNLHFKKMN